jgi:solute carrier family 25 carnitine/acylcarnitine transporter 20/29
MYRAATVTCFREMGTFFTYFGTYEYIIRKLTPEGKSRDDLAIGYYFLSGGLSGYMYWLPWYPLDMIKSKMQADSLANPRYGSWIDCAKKTMEAEGVKGFYKGFTPCLLRAFPANAATFLAFEVTLKILGRD